MKRLNFNIYVACGLGFLGASCAMEPQPTEPRDEAPISIEPGEPVTSLSVIEGFWLVERFEDFTPSWRNNTSWRRAYVQVGSEELSYSIGCNHSGNPASLGSDGILRDTGNGSRMQTLIGCDPESSQRDGRFFSFFGGEPKVRRLGEDRILFSGGADELVLIEPEAWRLANVPELSEVTGRWIPRMSLNYDGWGHEGFGIGDDPGVITIAPDALAWSKCPNSPIRVRWSADGRFSNTGGDLKPCRSTDFATRNGPHQLMEILASDPAIIRTGPQHIALLDGTAAKGRVIYLQTEESVLNPPPLPPPPSGADMPPPPPEPPPPPVVE